MSIRNVITLKGKALRALQNSYIAYILCCSHPQAASSWCQALKLKYKYCIVYTVNKGTFSGPGSLSGLIESPPSTRVFISSMQKFISLFLTDQYIHYAMRSVQTLLYCSTVQCTLYKVLVHYILVSVLYIVQYRHTVGGSLYRKLCKRWIQIPVCTVIYMEIGSKHFAPLSKHDLLSRCTFIKSS